MKRQSKNPYGDWSAMDARHEAERKVWANAELKKLNHFYDEIGWLGAQFKAACDAAACSEKFDFDWTSNTRAAANTYHVSKGFLNEIVYGKTVLSDQNKLALFAARTHEHTHLAFQFEKIAAAHATPFNAATRIVLCPRDAIILNIMMERQAFAAELIFEDLLLDVRAGKRSADSGLSAPEIEGLLRGYILNLNPRTRWHSDEKFKTHYHEQVLERYEDLGRVRHMKHSGVVYARLGLDDIKPLNDFFGLRAFADDDAGLERFLTMPLTVGQEARLYRVNAALGIADEGALPRLTDALRARGLTPARFVEESRRNTLFCPGNPR